MSALRHLRAATRADGWLVLDYVQVRARPVVVRGRVVVQHQVKIDHPSEWNMASLRHALQLTGWRAQRVGQLAAAKGLVVCRAC